MLMSPDSSSKGSFNQMPSTVIRVQVQECSQSQQSSNQSTYMATSNVIFLNKTNVVGNNRIKMDSNVTTKLLHQSPQQNQLCQQQRPQTPEYTKSFPVMDTTVASSVKGEPDLNIGMCLFVEYVFFIRRALYVRSKINCFYEFQCYNCLSLSIPENIPA